MKPYIVTKKNSCHSMEYSASEVTALCRKYGLIKFKGHDYVNFDKEVGEMHLVIGNGHEKSYRLKYISECFYPFIECIADTRYTWYY